MAELLDQIQEAQDELDVLKESHDLIEKQLSFYQDNGYFDLDADGQFKNPQIEAAIKVWEAKHNKVVDRNDYGTILTIAMNIETEQHFLSDKIRFDTEEYDARKSAVEKAEQLKQDLQGDDPEKIQSAMIDFQNLEYDFTSKTTSQPNTQSVSSLDDLTANMLLDALPDSGVEVSFGFFALDDDASKERENKMKDTTISTPKM